MIPRLYADFWLAWLRAVWTPWFRPLPGGIYPPNQERGARRAENHGGAQETGAARAMTAPIERASDWEPERRGGEVVEFRREGAL